MSCSLICLLAKEPDLRLYASPFAHMQVLLVCLWLVINTCTSSHLDTTVSSQPDTCQICFSVSSSLSTSLSLSAHRAWGDEGQRHWKEHAQSTSSFHFCTWGFYWNDLIIFFSYLLYSAEMITHLSDGLCCFQFYMMMWSKNDSLSLDHPLVLVEDLLM